MPSDFRPLSSVLRPLAHRLRYVTDPEYDVLAAYVKRNFGCLHGLVQAVEKEAGKLSKAVAAVTSLLVLAFWSRGLWSSGPVVS